MKNHRMMLNQLVGKLQNKKTRNFYFFKTTIPTLNIFLAQKNMKNVNVIKNRRTFTKYSRNKV